MRNVYKVIKSGNEWHAGVDRRDFGTKQDFIPLFFFMHVKIIWQGQKAVLTVVEFKIFDIFCFKFQLVSTFSICSKFCVENGLLCCDPICKWVTCAWVDVRGFGNQLFIYRHQNHSNMPEKDFYSYPLPPQKKKKKKKRKEMKSKREKRKERGEGAAHFFLTPKPTILLGYSQME